MKPIKAVRFTHNVSNADLPSEGVMDRLNAALNMHTRKLIIKNAQGVPTSLGGSFSYDDSSYVGDVETPPSGTSGDDGKLVEHLNDIYSRLAKTSHAVVEGVIHTDRGRKVELMLPSSEGEVPYLEWWEDVGGGLASQRTASRRTLPIPVPAEVMASAEEPAVDGDIVWSMPYLAVFNIGGYSPFPFPLIGNDAQTNTNPGNPFLTRHWKPNYSATFPTAMTTHWFGGCYYLEIVSRRLTVDTTKPMSQWRPAYDKQPIRLARLLVEARWPIYGKENGSYDEITIY